MARGIVYSTVDGPRGDHLQCHDGPGGPILGGTTYSMALPASTVETQYGGD